MYPKPSGIFASTKKAACFGGFPLDIIFRSKRIYAEKTSVESIELTARSDMPSIGSSTPQNRDRLDSFCQWRSGGAP